MIQVDSSKHGIGAVLLQEGHPVEYASRALTPSERNWAQIEKEALSVLKRLDEICEATSCDASLQSVMKLVLEGWPAGKRETPVCALPYFDVRDCLSVVDGILVKGEAVVIPMALTRSIKRRLHSAHLGRDSMLRRARGTVYWPNMASDIKQIADMCETSQEMKPRNPPEPLKQHSDGDEP